MMRPNGVEKQVRPSGWQPGANTIAYYKFNGNGNDSSGSGYNITTASNVTYNTSLSNGQKVAYLHGNNSYMGYDGLNVSLSNITISIWIKRTSEESGSTYVKIANNTFPYFKISSLRGLTGNIGFEYKYSNSNLAIGYNNTGMANDVWRHVVLVGDSNTIKLYQNGQQLAITYDSGNSSVGIGTYTYNYIRFGPGAEGYISEAIIESKSRTAQEISDYYNQTKGNYGL